MASRRKIGIQEGRKKGVLTILRFVKVSNRKGSIWECLCVCGKTKELPLKEFNVNRHTSCVCSKGNRWSKITEEVITNEFDPPEFSTRKCRSCDKFLTLDRWWHCIKCRPDLGEDLDFSYHEKAYIYG